MTIVPVFRFHPSPFGSGALEDSPEACECCGLACGVLCTTGPRCAADVERVCPWCVADGSAAARWGATFTDGAFTDSWGGTVDLGPELFDEVFRRTPGFSTLQPVSWWVHCGLPAAFLRVEDDRVRFRCVACGKGRSFRDLE